MREPGSPPGAGRRRVPTGLAVAGAVALGLLGVVAALLRPGAPDAPPPERDWRAQIAAWRHPDGLPDLPLIDEHGAPFGLHALADRWVLVGFVFTRCGNQEACPLTMAQMRAVQTAWTDDLPPLHLLTLTIDPAYDTPERLRAYAEAFGREPGGPVPWTLATGDPALMEEGLPALFNLLVLPEDGTLTHTVKLALLSPGLVLEEEWQGRVEPDVIFARMR